MCICPLLFVWPHAKAHFFIPFINVEHGFDEDCVARKLEKKLMLNAYPPQVFKGKARCNLEFFTFLPPPTALACSGQI